MPDDSHLTYEQIREAIDSDPLLRTAERGLRIEQEAHGSETVRMLVEAAQNDRQSALNELAHCSPADIKAVTQAQFRYHVCNAILSYIDQAIKNGRTAQETVEEQEAPD